MIVASAARPGAPVRRLTMSEPTNQNRPSARVIAALVIAFIVGLIVRELAYRYTGPIRYELNQRNAFYWGDRIVHRDVDVRSGAASWRDFWRSYVAIYDDNAAQPAPAINTLDYVPLRLLMAGAWVQYLNLAYGPVSEWRPEFARSFCAFSMTMELLAATAMFALVARYLQKRGHYSFPEKSDVPFCPDRWAAAAGAAILFWLNPASIVDSHVWPHGQTWILPFYLAAVLAMIEGRSMLAGVIYGIGIMFKGQMLLVAPMLILWPAFDRRFAASAKVACGMLIGVGLITWPWLSYGSFTWVRAGFGATGIYSDVLRKGTALNFPALLEKIRGAMLHERIVDLNVLGHHLTLELRTALITIYAAMLVLVARGIAHQARSNDRRLLVSIAAPWALMFFMLGQMDERYLVWSACLTAAAIAVDRRSVVCHVLLTFAGAMTMIEFLLVEEPTAAPWLMRLLIKLNPIAWLAITGSVAYLFVRSVKFAPRSDQATKQLLPAITASCPS